MERIIKWLECAHLKGGSIDATLKGSNSMTLSSGRLGGVGRRECEEEHEMG